MYFDFFKMDIDKMKNTLLLFKKLVLVNLDWAGPISKSDANKKMLNDKIVIIPQSRIRPFVIKVIIDKIECLLPKRRG
jgi:hypothetical protein